VVPDRLPRLSRSPCSWCKSYGPGGSSRAISRPLIGRFRSRPLRLRLRRTGSASVPSAAATSA
jgi:hypothetical protein